MTLKPVATSVFSVDLYFGGTYIGLPYKSMNQRKYFLNNAIQKMHVSAIGTNTPLNENCQELNGLKVITNNEIKVGN